LLKATVAVVVDRDIRCARLNLRVAIGAKKDALPRLVANFFDCPSDPAAADRECLQGRIEMVKLQRARMIVKSTNRASTASFADEDFLDASSSSGHGLGIASPTAKSAIGTHCENGQAVLSALRLHVLEPLLLCFSELTDPSRRSVVSPSLTIQYFTVE
jgi:hypothetical protein